MNRCVYSDVPFNAHTDSCIETYIVFVKWKSSINKLALCKLELPCRAFYWLSFPKAIFGQSDCSKPYCLFSELKHKMIYIFSSHLAT